MMPFSKNVGNKAKYFTNKPKFNVNLFFKIKRKSAQVSYIILELESKEFQIFERLKKPTPSSSVADGPRWLLLSVNWAVQWRHPEPICFLNKSNLAPSTLL